MNLIVKSNVLSESRISDYVGMYTEDQGYNGKKSFYFYQINLFCKEMQLVRTYRLGVMMQDRTVNRSL